MENIVFENELLNKYFKDILEKEEFTIEDLSALYGNDKYISSQYVGETLTQHDLDVLLSLNEVTFRGIDFESLKFKDSKMESLTLVDCNTQNIEFENYELNCLTLIRGKYKEASLEQFTEIYGIQRLKIVGEDIPNRDKILSEHPDYNSLPQEEKNKIYFDPENRLKQAMNLDSLSKFKELKSLNLNNMVLDIDISSFLEYPELEFLILDNNDNLGIDAINALEQLVQKGVYLSFKDTDAERFLSQKEFVIEDEEVAEKIKRIFSISSYDTINSYNLFKKLPRENFYIRDAEVLETLLSTGLIDLIKAENINIEIESFENLNVESISKLGEKVKGIKIKSFRGLTSEILEKLKDIEWSVEGDLLTSMDNYYTSEDMKDILQVLVTIKNSIPAEASDLEKFLAVYKSIGLHASYDRSGNAGNENNTAERTKLARSLKGVLIDGVAVCAGYKLATKYALDYSAGLDAREVSGYAYGDPDKGHGWNQVKIDGVWYNTDLTWDYRTIQSGTRTGKYTILENCLQSDAEFYKTHTPDPNRTVEICEECYNPEKIRETLQIMHQTQLDKNSFDATKEASNSTDIGLNSTVTIESLRNISESHSINSNTLNDLKQIMDSNIGRDSKTRKEIPSNEL